MRCFDLGGNPIARVGTKFNGPHVAVKETIDGFKHLTLVAFCFFDGSIWLCPHRGKGKFNQSTSNVMFCVDKKMSEVWPQVASIEITAKEAYRHAFGEPFVKEYTLGYGQDSIAEFAIPCLNDDCTGRGFSLYGTVAGMVAHHKASEKGTLLCDGKEARDHGDNRCPCVCGI